MIPADRSCKTAKDSRGATIRVGDRVTAISIYDGSSMSTGTVVEMWRQGANGTILLLDVPPDPRFPHHRSHPCRHIVRATR